MFVAKLIALVFAASSALAALPSGTVTCGDNKYSVSELTAAINAGIKDLDANNLPGECMRSGNPKRLVDLFLM